MNAIVATLSAASLLLSAAPERSAKPEDRARPAARATGDEGGPRDQVGAQGFKHALRFLQAIKPAQARGDDALASRWAKAQGEILGHLLATGATEARAGGRPTLVIDIHDTLEGIDTAGLAQNDPRVEATPGGPEFLADALGRGLRVILLSNTVERYRVSEIATLQRLGYPVHDDHLTLILKPDSKERKWDSRTWKGKAATLIAGMGGHVIAHFDDKAENLEAMSRLFKDSVPLQMSLDGPKAHEIVDRLPKLRDLRF